jgi:hypothetical protein
VDTTNKTASECGLYTEFGIFLSFLDNILATTLWGEYLEGLCSSVLSNDEDDFFLGDFDLTPYKGFILERIFLLGT